MKQEFKLLRAIIAEHAPQEYEYTPNRGEPRARQADYAMVEVIPVSDPNSSTMAQRVVQYQTVLQMSQATPQIYDLPQLHRQMIEVLGIKNADKLVPTSDDVKPADPVSENMSALIGKPIKAFMYQEQEAHIAVHEAFLQDPQIAAFIGQNPAAQQITSVLKAHLSEHMAFLYRQQMEAKLGMSLPPPNEELPEEMEVELAKLMAEGGSELTQQKQAEAAQMQAQQQAKDPIFQMKQEELRLKAGELERKAAKDVADTGIDQERLELEKNKAIIAATNEAARIDAQVEQADKKADIDAAKTLLAMAKRDIKESKD
jgi:hypothetical protein